MIKILAITTLVAATAGTPNNGRIVGGQDAEPYAYPYMAQVHAYTADPFTTGNIYMIECSGTLISDQWVLTGAACLYDNLPPVGGFDVVRENGIVIRLGAHLGLDYGPFPSMPNAVEACTIWEQPTVTSNAQPNLPYPVISEPTRMCFYTKTFVVFGDPNFLPSFGTGVPALIKLPEPIVFTDEVKPVELADALPSGGEIARVVAWGSETSFFAVGSRPKTLQTRGDITLLNTEDCIDLFADSFYPAEDRHICSLGELLCYYDFGGALVSEVTGQLIGIPSSWAGEQNTGDQCQSEGALFLSIPFYYEWIVQTIAEN